METLKRTSLLLIIAILCSVFCVSCDSAQHSSTIEIPPSYEEQFEDVAYAECVYILNKNTHKFHYKDCYTIDQMLEKNKVYCDDNRTNIIEHHYKPCKKCNP
jgi:DNA-entry nuclease